jgi:DNA-binding winged helix-turn-helix (wHTH) protein
MSASRRAYEFGDFRLEVAQRQLLLKTATRPLPLTSRAFETLLYLVEHRGGLLDKASLMKAIWPNAIVEDNSLNQNISLLRTWRARGMRWLKREPTLPSLRWQAAIPQAS